MVVQLLNFILVYLVLLSFHLLLLSKLVLVGLAKSINFIYSLFVFIDLMVSVGFLAGRISLSFVGLRHVLLLKFNDFLVQLLAFLLFFLVAFSQRSNLEPVRLQTFLVLGKLLIETINCSLVLGVSFVHYLFSVLEITLELLYLSLVLT